MPPPISVQALPRLTQASIALTRSVEVTDERGHRVVVRVPAERALTIYVDRTEVVTLMTLGAHPERLVLGYLLNQRLVESVNDIESITVDWEISAAAVRTRSIKVSRPERNASRIVTTGCGQGSMFSDLLEQLEPIADDHPRLAQNTLAEIVDAVRRHDTLYKAAGSVHACALFAGASMRVFVEDVGRHNALDSIAGWRALEPTGRSDSAVTPQQRVPSLLAQLRPEARDARGHGSGRLSGPQGIAGAGSIHPADPMAADAACPVLYTTGRLTSEMIIKAAQMRVPVVVSRSGTTEMAIQVALQHRVCAIGRALNRRFICYTHPWRIAFDPPIDRQQGPDR